MKTVLVFVLALAAGAAGGLAANLILPPPEQPRGSGAPDAALTRVEDVEERLARVEEALRRVEAAGDIARAAAGVPAPVAAPPAPAAGEAAAPDTTAAAADPALEQKIREVIEERDRVQREEAQKRMEEGMKARETEFLDSLEKDLGLNAFQREEMGRILAERRAAMQQVRDRYFTGMGPPPAENRDAVRQEMQKIRETSDQKIQAVLTPDQYQSFKERDGDRGPGLGGGPGMSGPPRGR